MLTSFWLLDSAFSNPADSCPTLTETSPVEEEHSVFHLPAIERNSLLGAISTRDIDWDFVSGSQPTTTTKKTTTPKLAATREAMSNNCDAIQPEDDLKRLIENETRLRLSGYYYGNLSWVDASHILKRSKVGTFLVRDSEHCSYLYALSVQTRRGPTSCRIDYDCGRFRLDSSEDLSDKMPRFDTVTDLIDHYVHLTQNLPRKTASKECSPVWLDMDEENSRDVPVQIYKPLYKNVRSLQHICRVTLMKLQKVGHPSMAPSRTNACDILPTVLKKYLNEYPYSQ